MKPKKKSPKSRTPKPATKPKRPPGSPKRKTAAAADELVQPKKAAFLAAYAKLGNITAAADAAKIGRQTVYEWRNSCPEFCEAMDDARRAACDYLEAEARRRAVEGWTEPVFNQGFQCGTIRRFSDTLLIFLLKGNNPEKFRDKLQLSAGDETQIKLYATLGPDDL